MKVVVEMRERDYNTMKKGFLIVGVQDGKPLDDVLNEIKTEIEEIRHREKCWCSDCLNIIDKYKTPHWIERRLSMGIHDWMCSVCKCQSEDTVKICPNCGVDTGGRYEMEDDDGGYWLKQTATKEGE